MRFRAISSCSLAKKIRINQPPVNSEVREKQDQILADSGLPHDMNVVATLLAYAAIYLHLKLISNEGRMYLIVLMCVLLRFLYCCSNHLLS
jgi:hypothetical protein